MAERLSNLSITTLNGAINNSTTSLVVASATLFPSGGDFRIIIDSEIMLVTAVSGTTFTVTRGVESTTAASHANGASIAAIQTEGSIRAWQADACLKSTYSSAISTSSSAGRVNFTTDSPFLLVDDGTNIKYHAPVWSMKEPIDGDFIWVNQGSATVSTTNGGVLLNDPSPGTSNNLRIRKKTKPTVPYVITAFGYPSWITIQATGVYNAGILMRESGTSKIATWQFTIAAGGDNSYLEQSRWTNVTTFSASPVLIDAKDLAYDEIPWLRMEETSTNIKFYYSTDGINWFLALDQAKTVAFTTAPDEVGFFVNASNTFNSPSYHLLSWSEA